MSNATEKKVIIVPMANLIAGAIFDKRNIQVPFERVVAAVNEIDPDFGALLQEGKGYTLIADPVTLAMAKAQQEQFQQPHAQPQYRQQPHQAFGGYMGASPYGVVTFFGIIPNGHDRVLIVSGQAQGADMNMTQVIYPAQLAAMQFGAVLDQILGDNPAVNRGFVAE